MKLYSGFLSVNRDYESWKWENALKFLSNNLSYFWNFADAPIYEAEIRDYVDVNFSIANIENYSEKLGNETFLSTFWASIKFNVTLSPKGRTDWKNDKKYIYTTFDFYVGNKYSLSNFRSIISNTVRVNSSVFTSIKPIETVNAEGNTIDKFTVLRNESFKRFDELLKTNLTLRELFKFLNIWLKVYILEITKSDSKKAYKAQIEVAFSRKSITGFHQVNVLEFEIE